MTTVACFRPKIVDEFAAHLGVDAVGAADGSVSFIFSHAGILNFLGDGSSGDIFVSLSRECQFKEPSRLMAFMSKAGFNSSLGCLVHTGLSADGFLVAAVRADARSLSVPEIVRYFERLSELHQAVS